MGFQSLSELRAFVTGLDVPEERREIVEAELLDHFFARVAGGSSEAEALRAFGDAEALRIRFEPVERGFHLSRRQALRDGLMVGAGYLFAAAAAWMTLHSG